MNDSNVVMNQFYDNVQKKYMPAEMAETLFINPMTDIYHTLRKLLKDNNIVTADVLEEQQRIEKIIDSIVKVQSELVKQTRSPQIQILISKMTKEIKDSIGKDTEDLIS
jgi:hypothetical protein